MNLICSSVFIDTKEGELLHLQVDEKETRQIFKGKSGVYGADEIVLSNDGSQVILVCYNEQILSFDSKKGSQNWTSLFESITAIPKGAACGDFTGNGRDEIIVARSGPTNLARDTTIIFNDQGKRLQTVPTEQPDASYSGADNILLVDVDDDGKLELVISYGAGLWDNENHTGKYKIEIWRWDQELKLSESWEGDDIGGNTSLLFYPKKRYILTCGWFNNPVRAFDAQGSLVWEITLFKDERYPNGDTRIYLYENEGKAQIIAVSNDYYRNKVESRIFILDPETGKILETYNELDHGFLGPGAVLGSSYFREENLQGKDKAKNFVSMDLKGERQLVRMEFPFEANRALLTGISTHKNVVTILQDEEFMILQDKAGYIWMVRDGIFRKLYHEPLISISSILIKNDFLPFEGKRILDHRNGIGDFLVNVLRNSLNLISMVGNKWIDRYQMYKFNNYYKGDWQNQFYYRMNKIIVRLVSTNALLESQLELDELSQKVYGEIEPPEDMGFLHQNHQLVRISQNQNFIHLRTWLEHSPQKMDQLKIGDIAILLELLEVFPGSIARIELVSIFNHVKKSTIYRRIGILEDLNLLEKKGNLLDMTSNEIVLSNIGLELITSLYITLEDAFIMGM